MKTFVVTLPPPGPSTLAQLPGARWMAKFIEWEATPAGTHGQVKRVT